MRPPTEPNESGEGEKEGRGEDGSRYAAAFTAFLACARMLEGISNGLRRYGAEESLGAHVCRRKALHTHFLE